mmetsp:Transcript_23454/g.42100  ORF Transcript_23454/g.42100 Transcript_23454/m.42100 type:complete len:138 (+) Transcript_23454:395-808(+)
MSPPSVLVIFHPWQCTIAIIANSIPTKISIDCQIPLACINTTSGVVGQSVKINQGSGNPTRISKMLLPMELDTAMSPSPILATITLESKSGTDVPAARTVYPITTEGIPMVFPRISTQLTMAREKSPIHTIESANEA